eukprot:8168098-Pyramimonas_sp.AAC.1
MAMSLLDSRNGSTESMRAAQAYPPYAQQQASRQVAERLGLRGACSSDHRRLQVADLLFGGTPREEG